MKFQECQHVLSDGDTCRAPRLRHEQFCYFHVATRDRVKRQQRAAARRLPLQVPVLEDPWTVQLALGDIVNAMLNDRIDHKKAALALYALQTASANMKNLSNLGRPQSYAEYTPELQASMPEDVVAETIREEVACEEEPISQPAAVQEPTPEARPEMPHSPSVESVPRKLRKHKIPPKKPVASIKPPRYRTPLDRIREFEVAAKKEEIWAVKQYTKAYKEGRAEPLQWAIDEALEAPRKLQEDRDFVDTEMAALRNRMKNNRRRRA